LEKKPRILFFDIETAPLLGWAWTSYETNIIDIKSSWYILSIAYKWHGEKKVKTKALPDYRGYHKDTECDRELVKDFHKLLDEADIVIAHNGDRFDLKKLNARFIANGLTPPSPYKSIDTLKIARKNFAFISNKLNDLGACLGVGRKLPHTGWHLWRGCMLGDMKSWRLMRQYNARDVELLERVYLKLRPWHATHPDVNAYKPKEKRVGEECPACGSTNTQKRGKHYARKRQYQKHQCQETGCGHYFVGEVIKDETKQRNVAR
jgi:uncharacterized protein YprB with RNaseH-like and TPR domain